MTEPGKEGVYSRGRGRRAFTARGRVNCARLVPNLGDDA